MNTDLKEITIRDMCEGFEYSKDENKGLLGLSGRLVIQPAYQRNYFYAEYRKDVPVIESILKGYPIGLIYLNKIDDDHLEVLDGQQRITSIGRFLTGKFDVENENEVMQFFNNLSPEEQTKILETKLLIYECTGTETEIKRWFQIINTVGVPLNDQELLNAAYSGPFVTKAREEFSNNQSVLDKWKSYISGNVNRQDFLKRALYWVSNRNVNEDNPESIDNIDKYMSLHRTDANINELKSYFNNVIDWIGNVFIEAPAEMRGLNWGALYRKYHTVSYDKFDIAAKVTALYNEECVTNHKGIFEYVLGGSLEPSLLKINVRSFDQGIKRTVFQLQTTTANAKGESNCPSCAQSGQENLIKRLYKLDEMEADHVTAWSKGGTSNIENCQVLCKVHNRNKGNR